MLLDQILEATRERVRLLPQCGPRTFMDNPRSLSEVIHSVNGRNAVIAELKFASPVRGTLRHSPSPLLLSKQMIEAGCIGLSVLTEPVFFGGSTTTLQQVRKISPVPILRKDFIIDERQVYETREMGADAILLIAGILKERLQSFVDLSFNLGLEPLVEVHTQGDIKNTLTTDAPIVGINNRNLDTQEIDLGITPKLSPLFEGKDTTLISMSGIETPQDIRYLKKYCHAFLIGTALMRSQHPRATLEEFVFA